MTRRHLAARVGSSCFLALFGMLATQRHRAQGEQLAAAQHELAKLQSRHQTLERKLRSYTGLQGVQELTTASGSADTGTGEPLLATAELVQYEMRAGQPARFRSDA